MTKVGRFLSLHAGHGSINYTAMYYGGPYLFEKITSSRYLGGGPNVLEGPIFSSIHYGGSIFRNLVPADYRGSKSFRGGPNFTVK